MSKTIKKGEFAGLIQISEEDLEKQHKDAVSSIGFPVYTVPVCYCIGSQQNCKGGDIDKCQNACWCGQCVDPSRAETAPVTKITIGFQDLLDIPKFLAQPAVK